MKRIVDKGLLLAGGLLMAGQSGRLAAPVIALLLAMTAAAYGSCVDNRRWHCVCLAGMFAVCFILPELCFFVPVLLYDCAEKKEMRLCPHMPPYFRDIFHFPAHVMITISSL